MRPLRLSTLLIIGIGWFIISPIFSSVPIQTPCFFGNDAESWRRLGVVLPIENPLVRANGRIAYVPVDATGKVSVSMVHLESGGYLYRYTLTNTGKAHISSFGIERQSPFDQVFEGLGYYTQYGLFWWQFANQVNTETRLFDVSDGARSGRVPLKDFGLRPGDSIGVWVASNAPPGYVTFAVRGNGWMVDVSQNRVVPPPEDFGYTGLVIGPNPAATRLTAVSFLNYILTQPGFAKAQGWITPEREVELTKILSKLKDTIGATGHLGVCDDVLSDIRDDQSELGQMLRLNIYYYRDQFLAQKDR